MDLRTLQSHWDLFGRTDPLWAILTAPGKRAGGWRPAEFFATGDTTVTGLVDRAGELGLVRWGRALDFGCGVGRLTQALADHFDECWGVDIAPAMVRRAEEFNRHGRRCQYVVNADADLRQFDTGSFDLVCTLLVLQHMEPANARAYLGEFLRVLAPGGLLMFQLPGVFNHLEPRPGLLPEGAHRARIRVSSGRVFGRPSEQVRVEATVTNESGARWDECVDGPMVWVGNHWYSQDGELLARDDSRTPLPSPLGPGESATVSLRAVLPDCPGRFVFQIDLLEAGGQRFQDRGGPPPATVRVRVDRSVGWLSRAWAALTGRGAVDDGPAVPVMEMYGTDPAEVTAWLVAGGGKVLRVDEDGAGGPEIPSYTYWVRKGD